MKTINFSETQNDLRAVLNQVGETDDALSVVQPDGSVVVMLTLEQYRGLMETAHLLSSPANAAHLARSIAQLRAGEVVDRELIAADDSDVQPAVHK